MSELFSGGGGVQLPSSFCYHADSLLFVMASRKPWILQYPSQDGKMVSGWQDGVRPGKMVSGPARWCQAVKKVSDWQDGVRLARQCQADKMVSGWQDGVRLARRCQADKMVSGWQDGVRLARRCQAGKTVSG